MVGALVAAREGVAGRETAGEVAAAAWASAAAGEALAKAGEAALV